MTPKEFSETIALLDKITARRSQAIWLKLREWDIALGDEPDFDPDQYATKIAQAIQTMASYRRVPTTNDHTAMEYLADLMTLINSENEALEKFQTYTTEPFGIADMIFVGKEFIAVIQELASIDESQG